MKQFRHSHLWITKDIDLYKVSEMQLRIILHLIRHKITASKIIPLNERTKKILIGRFDLKSYREIGMGMNISGERVRQIEHKAAYIMSHPINLKLIKEILS